MENVFHGSFVLRKIFSIIKNLLQKTFPIIQKAITENVFHNTKIYYGKHFS